MNNQSYKGVFVDGGFAAVPRFVIRRNHPLSWSAQLVYLHLRDHCDVNSECYPSIATLCFECGGIGRNTVVKALRELEDMHLIQRYHRHNPKTKAMMSNGYKVPFTPQKESDVDAEQLPDWEPLETSDGETPLSLQDTDHIARREPQPSTVRTPSLRDTYPHPDGYGPRPSTVHEVETFKKNQEKYNHLSNTPIAPNGGMSDTTPEDCETDNQIDEQSALFDAPTEPEHKPKRQASTGYTDDFEAFWNVYPLKLDKRTAFKAFRRALKRTTLDEIMTGARKYANDPNLPEPRFIKHASTWLNGDGWDNPPLPSSKPVSGQPNKARERLNEQVDIVRRIQALEQQGTVVYGMELER